MPLPDKNRPLFPPRVANGILLLVCGLILCGIFIAGLSPFTPHLKNQVRWLDRQNGLYFGEYASILSSAPLRVDGLPDGPCSVELWIQPGVIDDSNTILAFQTPETPLQFRIQQNNDALMLTRRVAGPDRQVSKKFIYIADAFRQDTLVLITVTSGAQGTAVYLNGILTRSSADFGLTRHDLNGGIVVGNSPVVNDSWSGVLRGIGIYNQELPADQVRRGYEQWTRSGQPRDLEEKKAVAIYPFTERSGKVVHSQVPSAVDLQIPDYYVVLYPPFLQPFWKHWGWNWAFWKDGLVNATGFMPLGFFFCAYFSLSRPINRAMVLATIFGCAISFIIEATQFYLPTRDSDSMDFINNTLGTVLGALCNRPRFVQDMLARFGIVSLENSRANPVSSDVLLKAS
jgi:VanZ like family/Concanavalin A-like lectin/glucanases superfamily